MRNSTVIVWIPPLKKTKYISTVFIKINYYVSKTNTSSILEHLTELDITIQNMLELKAFECTYLLCIFPIFNRKIQSGLPGVDQVF